MVAHHVAVQAGFRHRLYVEMEPSERQRQGISPVNLFIIALVLLSFVVFALETEPTIPANVQTWLGILNLAILAAFAVEYVIRVWVAGEDPACRGAPGRIRYIFLDPMRLPTLQLSSRSCSGWRWSRRGRAARS